MTYIHPTTIVHPSVKFAADATIGPYTIVEIEVTGGADYRVGGYVKLGKGATIGFHASDARLLTVAKRGPVWYAIQ